jgi:hypothetical protein
VATRPLPLYPRSYLQSQRSDCATGINLKLRRLGVN